ncbi:MAG: hypothetical protein ACT4P1_17445 [Sporichthyaceae bacterium]
MSIRTHLRRTAVTTAAIAALGAGMAPAALAAPAPAERAELGLEDIFRTHALPVAFTFTPRAGLTATGAELLTRTVDALGNTVSAVSTKKLRTSGIVGAANAPAIDNFACVKNGSAKKFTTHDPRDIYVQSRAGTLRYLIETYEQRSARRVNDRPQTQVQICVTGGADLDGGWRATRSGVGMFLADRHDTKLRGHQWQAGDNTGDLRQSLAFDISGKKVPVNISASLTQGAGDRMEGSFVGPTPTFLNMYSRNAAVGWWEDGCTSGWTRCKAPTDGQTAFRGAIVQGLWEFDPIELRQQQTFYVVPYLDDRCPAAQQPCAS